MSHYLYGTPEYWAALANGDITWDQAEMDADRAGEGNPRERQRPGRPTIPPHDMQIRAMARLARPISKADLAAEIGKAGRVKSMTGGHDISDSAGRLLVLLVNELTGCAKGDFMLKITNGTLAARMGKADRTIKRLLAELHWSGWIYRHYQGSDAYHGLDRAAIDLGPTVYRLPELRADRAQQEFERKAVRAEMNATPSMPLPAEGLGGRMNKSPPGDINVPRYTNQHPQKSGTSNRTEQGVARGTRSPGPTVDHPADTPHPIGQPTRSTRRAIKVKPAGILAICPDFAAITHGQGWPDLHRAATKLYPTLGLSAQGWRDVEEALGPEGATLAVALTSEKARRGQIQRPAAYLRGIAQKVTRGESVNLEASYFSIARSTTSATL